MIIKLFFVIDFPQEKPQVLIRTISWTLRVWLPGVAEALRGTPARGGSRASPPTARGPGSSSAGGTRRRDAPGVQSASGYAKSLAAQASGEPQTDG